MPFLIALRDVSPARAALLGGVWGVLAAEAVGTWFASGVATYYGRSLLLGAAFFAGVSLLLAAPFFAVFAAAYAYGSGRRTIVPAVIWAPMAWVACELARARLFVGNPWALLGDSQAGRPPVIQIADLTGVYGISFVLATVSVALVVVLARSSTRRTTRTACACAALTVAATLAYGRWALAKPARGAELDVAVVQGSVDVGTQWHPGQYGANLETYLRLSQRALARGRPRLVVWPEAAVTFFLEDEPAYRAAIGRLFRGSEAYLVTGGPAHAVDDRAGDPGNAADQPRAGADAFADGTRYFNSAFLLAPDGAIVDRYDKVHLMPFAEYFPLARVESLRRRFARVRTFSAGHALKPFAGAPYAIAPVICFEAMYPELVSAAVAAGGELLVNLTNDAWMGRTSFARQHLEIASLRAVENRRYLIRAASTGISAIVDPFGHVIAELGPFERDTLAASVRLNGERTFYARFGDAFAGACALGAVVVLATSRRRDPSEREHSAQG